MTRNGAVLLALTALVCAVHSGLHAQDPPAPATAQAPPPTIATPNDVYVAGRDGVSPPRVTREAKPQYTAQAMRARVQGAVRLRAIVERDGTVSGVEVIESLDPTLDQSAIDALKQWRFEPGMRNGQPVRVMISVDINFALRLDQSMQSWPNGFSAAPAPVGGIEERAAKARLRVTVVRPAGWTVQRDTTADEWLAIRSADGAESLTVRGPAEFGSDLRWPVPPQTVQELAQSVLRSQPVPDAEISATGQTQSSAAMFWVWTSIRLPSVPTPLGLAGQFRELRLWAFSATVNRQLVSVWCSVMIPKDLDAAATEARVRQAAADLAVIVNSVRIEVAPA